MTSLMNISLDPAIEQQINASSTWLYHLYDLQALSVRLKQQSQTCK